MQVCECGCGKQIESNSNRRQRYFNTSCRDRVYHVRYRKDRTTKPVLSRAPLIEKIEIAARAHVKRDEPSNYREVSRRVAARLGKNFEAVSRQLFRIKQHPNRPLALEVADEWAIGLGYHPSLIWPEWFQLEVA